MAERVGFNGESGWHIREGWGRGTLFTTAAMAIVNPGRCEGVVP